MPSEQNKLITDIMLEIVKIRCETKSKPDIPISSKDIRIYDSCDKIQELCNSLRQCSR